MGVKEPATGSAFPKRSEVVRESPTNWAMLWPIALAPVFPLLAITLRYAQA